MSGVRRSLIISALVLVVLAGLAFTAAFLIDEPLRRYVETQMNQRLEGYVSARSGREKGRKAPVKAGARRAGARRRGQRRAA